MKINKKILLDIGIVILFLFSTFLALYKIVGPKTTVCTLQTEDTDYKKREDILVKYRENKVQMIVYRESFSSEKEDIVYLKKTEYEEKGYRVTGNEKKIKAKKEEKITDKYKETIQTLIKEGYTCK